MLIQLPTGFVDGVDLFNYCEVDELRGRDQNYLADQKLINNIGHVPKLLGNMALSFQTKEGLRWLGDIKKDGIYRLPVSDIECILIRVRENTYGPRYYYQAECEHCGHHHKDLRLDLDKLEITPLSMEDRLKPKFVMLPKCKKEVELRPQYLKDLYELIKVSTDKQDQAITTIIKTSLKSIDKKEVLMSDIENLPSSDISFLMEEMDKFVLDGKMDDIAESTCESCNKDFKIKLNPLLPSFFFHIKASSNTNT